MLYGYVCGKCPDDCAQPVFIYESFQCKPICNNLNSDCPTQYNCSHINAQPNTCYFNGKHFNDGESVKNSLTWESCMGCSCEKLEPNIYDFLCYSAACANLVITEGCTAHHKLGLCCTSEEICPPFQTCSVSGKTFEEGPKFYHPNDNCTKCTCDRGKDMNATLKCEKQYCLDLLRNQNKIKRNCAPFYYNMPHDCCPSQWICPEDDITYENRTDVSSKTDIEAEPHCLFGNKSISKKEKFYSISYLGKIRCECIIPPYVTCSLSSDVQ